MDTPIRFLTLTAAFLVLNGCAASRPAAETTKPGLPPAAAAAPSPSPSGTAAAPTSDASATTQASGNTAPAAAKPNRIVLEDKTLTNEEVSQLFAQGYKPVGRNGQVYYCRREQQLGSRFETTTCKTAEQMKQITQDSKDMLSAKQRPGGCTSQGPGC